MGMLDKVQGGKFLTAEEVKTGAKTFLVSGFSEETFPDGARVVLDGTYESKPRGLVLSAANGKFLRTYLRNSATEESALVGGTVVLTTVQVNFRGKTVDSIRIAEVRLARTTKKGTR